MKKNLTKIWSMILSTTTKALEKNVLQHFMEGLSELDIRVKEKIDTNAYKEIKDVLVRRLKEKVIQKSLRNGKGASFFIKYPMTEDQALKALSIMEGKLIPPPPRRDKMIIIHREYAKIPLFDTDLPLALIIPLNTKGFTTIGRFNAQNINYVQKLCGLSESQVNFLEEFLKKYRSLN